MIEPFLKKQLEPIARRRRQWKTACDLALCWTAAAMVGLILFALYRTTGWISTWTLPVTAGAAVIAGLIVWRRARRWEPDFRHIARQIEERHPELHALLLTAVEQQPDTETGRFNFLQERVIQEAIGESKIRSWVDTVSSGRLFAAQILQVATFVLLLVVLTGLRVQTKEAAGLTKPTRLSVTPGDTSIEKGNGLAVLARVEGPLPPEVSLVLRPDGQAERRISMMKSLNDPVFGGTVPDVTNSFHYRVEFASGRSRDFKVEVFEFPRLERANAHLVYPGYTRQPDKTVEDTTRISAVEGSTLDLSLQLNKPVASAQLIAKDKTSLPLGVQTNQASASLVKYKLQSSQSFELQLVDLAGRTNKIPAQIIVEVLTNRAPELKFTSPRGDQKVSPLQEITFAGEVWDDFGLSGYGLTYSLEGGEAKTIEFGNSSTNREKRQFSHLLSLEELGAKPDQLLSYFIWADDIGPDGAVRRTASDRYYAEVRPFEEIFRQGQGQSGNEEESESGQGNEATKLAELQKQILNATWRLQRENRVGLRPNDAKASDSSAKKNELRPSYTKDVEVVEQSQKQAIKLAAAAKQEVDNPETQALWENVEKSMNRAASELGRATKSTEPLPAAVDAEQAAYQALMKLAAHEYRIAQSRRSRSQSNSQSMQRELDQLDLTESENRYETQKQASAKLNSEQREQLQVLNRLKELAQRQQDVNERLKELQTALKEAKTEQEREDLRRELKRLREQEQQMLADVDELLQRMERSENQSRMADSRQQLEQTRNQIQRTSEAIDKESVSQALSAGTRAERELQELRDDFRKKNSAAFAEDMRQMRSDARDVAQKEEQIGNKIQDLADAKRKTLSDAGERKQLSEQMAQQTQKMTNLLEQMSRVSQDAESSEPLLSKQLYDTLRKASQGNLEDSLKKSSQLLDLSFFKQAGEFEQRARTQINQVKEGVERAAESVLGDETEALRLARNELDDLAGQLQREIERAEQAGATNMAAAGQSGTGQPNERQPGNRSAQGGGESQANSQNQSTNSSKNQLANAEQGQQGENQPGQQGQNQSGQQGQGRDQQRQGQQRASAGDPSQQQQQDQQQPGTNPGQRGQGRSSQLAQQGRQPGGQAPSENPSQPDAQNPGQAPGQTPGQTPGQQANQGQNGSAPGQRPGQPRQRASLTNQPQRGQGANPQGNRAEQAQAQPGGQRRQPGGQPGPITGEDYTQWSDRLREVEELVDTPDMRNEVAGVRDRARALRIDFTRTKKSPQAATLRAQLAQPLAEVRQRINEELARRENKDSLVPIDRDPVPQKFTELVRRYYEKLGSGQPNESTTSPQPSPRP